VDKVPVDVQQRWAFRLGVDDMVIPDFLENRCGGQISWNKKIAKRVI
jgi:hypothetical protein